MNKRILVVEDQPDNRQIIRDMRCALYNTHVSVTIASEARRRTRNALQ